MLRNLAFFVQALLRRLSGKQISDSEKLEIKTQLSFLTRCLLKAQNSLFAFKIVVRAGDGVAAFEV